jgi:predicted porin
MTHKFLIQLTVFSVAALAFRATVSAAEINGYLMIGLDRSKMSGSTTSSENVSGTDMTSGASNLSISHSEELDNGMTGDVFLQFIMPTDTAQGNFQNRNSYVGLSGGFGAVRLGTNENAYERLIWEQNYQEGDWNYGTIQIMGIAPAGNGNDAELGSHIWDRTSNTLMYFGPDGPLKIEVDYAFAGSGTTATRTPSIMSLGLEYMVGESTKLMAGYQVATDWFGGAASTAARDDTGLLFGALFSMGQLEANVLMETLEYKDTTNNVTTEVSHWAINAKYPLATGTLALTYTAADDSDEDNAGTNTTADDGASSYTVGYYHPLGAATTLFAMYHKTTNDPQGTYNAWGPLVGVAGQDYTNYLAGIIMSF